MNKISVEQLLNSNDIKIGFEFEFFVQASKIRKPGTRNEDDIEFIDKKCKFLKGNKAEVPLYNLYECTKPSYHNFSNIADFFNITDKNIDLLNDKLKANKELFKILTNKKTFTLLSIDSLDLYINDNPGYHYRDPNIIASEFNLRLNLALELMEAKPKFGYGKNKNCILIPLHAFENPSIDDDDVDYGYDDDYSDNDDWNSGYGFTDAARDLKKYLEENYGFTAVIKKYQQTKKDDVWFINSDGSLFGCSKGQGIELVSPPMNVKDALINCEKIFDMIEKIGITNHTTGFHVNISINSDNEPDLFKLVLLSEPDKVLKMFKREKNTYSSSNIKQIIKMMKTCKVHEISNRKKLIEFLQKYGKFILAYKKYNAINLSKIHNGYIEFRSMGNKDYHKKFKRVRKIILNNASALALAYNPELGQSIYLKKIKELIAHIKPKNETKK